VLTHRAPAPCAVDRELCEPHEPPRPELSFRDALLGAYEPWYLCDQRQACSCKKGSRFRMMAAQNRTEHGMRPTYFPCEHTNPKSLMLNYGRRVVPHTWWERDPIQDDGF